MTGLLVPKAGHHLLRQIWVVTRIGLSTLRHRLRGAIVMVAGIGTMAFTLLALLCVAEGLHVVFLESGDPSRVVIRANTRGQVFQLNHSRLDPGIVAKTAAAPGIARGRNSVALIEA